MKKSFADLSYLFSYEDVSETNNTRLDLVGKKQIM